MIRFKIDSESTELLDRITNIYNFKRDTITGRIALSMSIDKGVLFQEDEINLPQNGREYTPTSNIFGRLINDIDNFILYKTIFDQHYNKELTENEFIKLYKLHLKNGLNYWINELEKCDLTKGDHITFLLKPIKKGLSMRSSNVYINNQNESQNNILKINSSKKPIELCFGTDSEGNSIKVKINDETEYTSRHFGIAGTTGSGKTQFVFDLIYQISKQTDYELKYTFFDFKGTDTKEKLESFLSSTKSTFINVNHQNGFPFSPLKNYDLSNQNYIESFASDFRTFFKDIRQVQSASLVREIKDYFFENNEAPSLDELLETILEKNKGKFDTTTSVIQQLINSGIYNESDTYSIFNQSTYISMPSEVTKEIKQFVTFNLLKYMYDSIKKSGDTIVTNNIKELKHIIVIDEAQNFLQHKNARPVIESMLRELRSMGIIIILIAQETQDFIYSDFNFMSQIQFPICANVNDKSSKRIIPFLGSVNSEVKLNTQLSRLDSGKGLINIVEPKLIELRQFWKTAKNEGL
jgi:DNA sulfur modification protein DndE